MRVDLPYGSRPYRLDVGNRDARILEGPALPPPRPTHALLEAALEAPIGAPALAAAPGSRVTLIVSDPSRDEPRAALIAAVRRRLPKVRWTIAIATGTHGRCGVERLGVPPELLRDAEVIDHDGASGVVELGVTSRGTPVRVHRCVIDTDLVIATGCIRPHYFAGFGAGGKAIFPGLGESAAIRINHRWKTAPGARAGVIDGNPCRDDLVEAVRMVRTPVFLLDGVCGPDGAVHAAVAGDLEAAFRAGAELARPWFTVRAARTPVVVASDALPVTASLYQAAKIAAAAAPLLEPRGTLVVVAECRDGIGPVDVVNEAIFRIGVLPRLPLGARIVLVSALSPADVGRTLLSRADSVESELARCSGPVSIVTRASQLICEADS